MIHLRDEPPDRFETPRLAHMLWAVVLLKCLTPPVIAVPWSLFGWLEHSVAWSAPAEDTLTGRPPDAGNGRTAGEVTLMMVQPRQLPTQPALEKNLAAEQQQQDAVRQSAEPADTSASK